MENVEQKRLFPQAYFENTGNFTAAGQFYIDVAAGKVLVSRPTGAGAPAEVVVGVTQTLMHAEASKNGRFEPFICKNDRFTKTGSGQT
jgi:hypothetical protein